MYYTNYGNDFCQDQARLGSRSVPADPRVQHGVGVAYLGAIVTCLCAVCAYTMVYTSVYGSHTTGRCYTLFCAHERGRFNDRRTPPPVKWADLTDACAFNERMLAALNAHACVKFFFWFLVFSFNRNHAAAQATVHLTAVCAPHPI